MTDSTPPSSFWFHRLKTRWRLFISSDFSGEMAWRLAAYDSSEAQSLASAKIGVPAKAVREWTNLIRRENAPSINPGLTWFLRSLPENTETQALKNDYLWKALLSFNVSALQACIDGGADLTHKGVADGLWNNGDSLRPLDWFLRNVHRYQDTDFDILAKTGSLLCSERYPLKKALIKIARDFQQKRFCTARFVKLLTCMNCDFSDIEIGRSLLNASFCNAFLNLELSSPEDDILPLLKAGVPLTIKDGDGCNAILLLLKKNNVEVSPLAREKFDMFFRALVVAGVDPGLCLPNGDTSLHVALLNPHGVSISPAILSDLLSLHPGALDRPYKSPLLSGFPADATPRKLLEMARDGEFPGGTWEGQSQLARQALNTFVFQKDLSDTCAEKVPACQHSRPRL